jgi:hypothetical protein
VQQDLPGNNFGQNALLISDLQVNAANSAAESYLRFNLTPLAGLNITQATLRMWVVNQSPGAQNIKNVADDTWTENGITYGSPAPPKGSVIATFVPGAPNVWAEVNITSAVAANAGSLFSFAIDNPSSDGYHFNSDEAATNRVELVINWSWGGGGGPTPTPTATPTTAGTPTPTPTRTPTPGPSGTPAPTPNPNGFQGPSYSGASAPTGEKPQSKLWYNDGIWWGSLINSGSRIHRLNLATQTWTNTNVQIDPRSHADVDALWDGTKLYIASVVPMSTAAADRAQLRRFSYNAATDTYTLDSGFPVNIGNAVSMETIVLAKDTTGKLWVTYTNTNAVWVIHTTTNDLTWGTAFTPPVSNVANLTADDISSIVAFDGKVGVMWGNQTPGIHSYFFATHTDGDGDMTWQSSVALPGNGSEMGDDHINLKALNGDPAGRVFAAVKTSLNGTNDPLIVLLVLRLDGTWANYTFGTAGQNHTRAIVEIDEQNRELYMFAAAPCCSGDVIYYKHVSLNVLAFPTGMGSSFMDSTNNCINNVSSTKQNLTSSTDLVVIAGADCASTYYHNSINLPQ